MRAQRRLKRGEGLNALEEGSECSKALEEESEGSKAFEKESECLKVLEEKRVLKGAQGEARAHRRSTRKRGLKGARRGSKGSKAC